MLVGPDGTIHGAARVPIEPYVSPRPGWAEQDPDVHWAALGEACRRVLAETADAGGGARGGHAHHPARHGRRDRRRRSAAAAGDHLARRPAGDRAAAVRRRRRADRPRVPGARPARHDRGLRRRVRGQLAARRGARDVVAHPALPAPERLPDPSPDRPVRGLGGGPGRLPAVRLQGDALGGARPLDAGPSPRSTRPGCPSSSRRRRGSARSSAAAAEATGLPVGLPVIAAAADKACEVLGSGAITAGHRRPVVRDGGDGQHDDRPATSRPSRSSRRSRRPLPGAWSMEIQVYRGYWMVEWFKREFGAAEVARAAADGRGRRRSCSTSSWRACRPARWA